MAVELATAYISIVPSTSKLAPAISKDLGQVEKTAKPAGNKIGDSMLAGIGKTLKFGALAVGGVAVAGIGAALVKGFGRLNSLDQATAKLSGLGMSAKTVQQIMDDALASVKGTAFGMDEAATTSAMAVAAGVKPGKQLEGVLKTIADTATIAGSSMGDMGQIFGSVAARGKLQGDDLMQLQSRGVPVLAFLAKHYGITAQAASEMVSKGKVDFKNFEAAMKENLGGAALKSGDTFQGTVDNMMAALGRFGANALQDIFPALKGGFGSITEWVDGLSTTMGPFFQTIGQGIGDFISGITMSKGDRAEFAGQMSGLVLIGANIRDAFEKIAGVVGAAFGFIAQHPDLFKTLAVGVGAFVGVLTIMSAVTKTATAIQLAFNSSILSNPVVAIVVGIVALVAALVWFFTQTKLGKEIWAAFTGFLVDAWNNTTKWISQALANIGKFFTDTWRNITTGVKVAIFLVQAVISTVVRTIRGIWEGAWRGIGNFFTGIWNGIVGAVRRFGGFFKDAFSGIRGFVVAAFKGVLGVVKAPINGIIGLINGAIRGLNSISVHIPDWVPIVGGQTWGISLPTIPRLATGAIVKSTSGGSLANLGEGRYDEAVIPLGGSQFQKLASALANANGADLTGYEISGRLEIGGDGLGRIIDGRIVKAMPSAVAVSSRFGQ